MKIVRKDRDQGFTLVEMIGVLAVIAVLAAMLIPKIFEVINNSKISNTVESLNTIKSAVGDHYGKWGKFADATGVALTAAMIAEPATGSAATYDTSVLLAAGLIDKGFAPKIGDTSLLGTRPKIQIRPGLPATTEVTGINAAYDLAGNGTTVNGAVGEAVVEAVITGVSAADAWALSTRLDGDAMSLTKVEYDVAAGTDDLKGRVKYAKIPPGASGLVYIYIAHR